jgi:hypothetical protein
MAKKRSLLEYEVNGVEHIKRNFANSIGYLGMFFFGTIAIFYLLVMLTNPVPSPSMEIAVKLATSVLFLFLVFWALFVPIMMLTHTKITFTKKGMFEYITPKRMRIFYYYGKDYLFMPWDKIVGFHLNNEFNTFRLEYKNMADTWTSPMMYPYDPKLRSKILAILKKNIK